VRSGDYILTGVGKHRRRLTEQEAQAGGSPERMLTSEWTRMFAASMMHEESARQRTVDALDALAPFLPRHD
jgi:hypothetical protein